MKTRTVWFYLFLGFGFLVLVFKTFWIQVVKKNHYQVLAEENRVKIEREFANRGVIFDRNQQVLARNTPDGRDYPFGKAVAHVVGYVGKVSESEWQKCLENESKGVECQMFFDEIVGKYGVEKQFNQTLKGVPGGVVYETDSQGKKVRQISQVEPQSGQDLTLSIDAGLSKKAYELIKDQKGAVVALNPQNGEVLSLVSSPSFDPKDIPQALKDDQQPLFNRAIGGLYPPGSTYKIITATAGLEEEKINASTKVEDTGEIRIGEYRFGNWLYDRTGGTEGQVDVVKAIKRSNDIFFYKVGEWLGARLLSDWSRLFGLGQTTGVELDGEAKGLVPDPDWKQDYKGERWFLGNTYHMAIGQGDLLTTPLQVGLMTNVVANQGKLCQPTLVKDQEPKCQNLGISQQNIDLVKEGMRQVCSEGGTSSRFTRFEVNGRHVQVAGKTGTAQFGHPEDKTHAWFTAFVPAQAPQISVTVLLEEAGEGSEKAAPVAYELLEWYLEKNQN